MKTMIAVIALLALCSIAYAADGDVIPKVINCVFFRGTGACM